MLLKRFSVILEKFWDVHPYQGSDVHVLNGLKNFKKIRKSEQKLYNALKKVNILFRLSYKVNEMLKTKDNLIVDYSTLNEFTCFNKFDLKILMKTDVETIKNNLKIRNGFTDENITLLEKSKIIKLTKEFDESKFDFVLDIKSSTFEKDKEKVFKAIEKHLQENKKCIDR